ncbi:MAG: hypothetical protein Q9225_000367 [Loekoesia sp. 1 TL-2023]
MPSQNRIRGAGDDLKPEASSSKEKSLPSHTSASAKARRNGDPSGSKESAVLLAEADASSSAQEGQNGIDWSTMDASTLNAYRQMRRLQVPPAFGSAFNQRVLCRVGVSRRSPTMAKHADRRKISKEQLALAVKKDFNDAMVNEPEAITTFLYSIRNQDKSFRMHFTP